MGNQDKKINYIYIIITIVLVISLIAIGINVINSDKGANENKVIYEENIVINNSEVNPNATSFSPKDPIDYPDTSIETPENK